MVVAGKCVAVAAGDAVMWCRHRWKTVGHVYESPSSRNFSLEGLAFRDLAMRLYLGYTSMLQVCKKCGRERVDVITGKVVDES